jgi:hypothetical protein
MVPHVPHEDQVILLAGLTMLAILALRLFLGVTF